MHAQLSEVQHGGCGFTHSVERKTPLMFVIHLVEFEQKQQLGIAVGFSAVSLVCISEGDKSLLCKKKRRQSNNLNKY